MEGRRDGGKDGWNGRMDEGKDGCKERLSEGRMDEGKYGWMKGRIGNIKSG